MTSCRTIIATVALAVTAWVPHGGATITTVADLVAAVSTGGENDVVHIGPGVFELGAPLEPKAGMTIIGAGAGQTIIRNDTAVWDVGNEGLPDNGTDQNTVVQTAYLFSFPNATNNVTIADVTLSGPELHGALYCNNCDNLTLERITFDSFLWSAVRVFRVSGGVIRDNTFIDAGGRANVTSGPTGGCIYGTFITTTDIFNNRFFRTPAGASNVFGVKGRKFNDSRIFDNTIDVSFSIELPFENDSGVEIFNNWLDGVVSIPKFAGGLTGLPEGGGFDIHHNYFTRTYSIEGPRNSTDIHTNLFDFSTEDDGGNLVSIFGNNGSPVSPGPFRFFNNNVKNPGRGVFWSAPVQNEAEFFNNHIIGSTTITPRTEGLFGIKLGPNNDGESVDLSTVSIRDNIIELTGLARPLLRGATPGSIPDTTVVNNTLINVSDTGSYTNADTGAPRGPLEPLCFRVGVDHEYTVDGFDLWCTADADRDSSVTGADVTALLGEVAAETCLGDVNNSGQADAFDVAAHQVLISRSCP
ncbi:MAG: hypothetical protein AAGI30_14235 [Planctomycetota bacterium]